jgi:hypothetical protein
MKEAVPVVLAGHQVADMVVATAGAVEEITAAAIEVEVAVAMEVTEVAAEAMAAEIVVATEVVVTVNKLRSHSKAQT